MSDVFVGGVQGFQSLGSSQAVQLLLQTGRIGLYMHADAIQNSYDDGSLAAITSAFHGTGSGFAELPFIESDATDWFSTTYNTLFAQNGLGPAEAAVDVPIDLDLAEWTAYVNAAADAGISRLSPIFSPNYADNPLGDFATIPQYASLRSAALMGGGLTLDTPPAYALARGRAYLDTVESEVRWARANNVRTTIILSPHDDYGVNFQQDTASYIAQLAADGALPDTWVVETYSSDGTTLVGSETDPQSVAGVALWVAQNQDSPASVPAGASTLSWSAPVHVAVGGAGQLTVGDTGGQASVVGGSGGLVVNSSGASDEIWTAAGSSNTVNVGASATINSQGQDTITTGANANVTVNGRATIHGGPGASTYTINGTATLFSQSSGTDLITANAGSALTANVTGAWFNLVDNGAGVRVNETGGGDNASLAVTGTALIYGGAGYGLSARTSAGQASTVTLGSGSYTIYSQGSDTIQGGTGASTYVVSGTATLNSRSAGTDTIETKSGSSATVNLTGIWANIINTGGSVRINETGSGDNAFVGLAGGNATVSGGAGYGLTTTTDASTATTVTVGAGSSLVRSNGNDTVRGGSGQLTFIGGSNASKVVGGSGAVVIEAGSGNLTVSGSNSADIFYAGTGNSIFTEGSGANAAYLGAGNATVVGGSGTNTYHFKAGQGTRAIDIQNFHTGTDKYDFQGFNGNAIASQAVSNGSLKVVLSDGATVTFDGVTKLS